MYNLYVEEKKINEKNKKIKEENEILLDNEKHKLKTNNLALNYQKRIKRFIIDVRFIFLLLFLQMAEDNPHIEVKKHPNPINNPRQQYLFENEKLILGRHGFVFREYSTLKERLQENLKEQKEFNKNLMNYKLSRNKNLTKINPENKNGKLNKSKSELNILSQPILRFKNRTDFERICDTIQQYVNPKEQESLREIRARHVKSIDFPTGLLYKGGFKGLKKLKSLNKNKTGNIFDHSNSTFNINKLDNDKLFEINNKDFDLNVTKKPKIYFTRLQRLNDEAKKIRSNLHFKTHFKGVESVFINPKQIYDIFKKEEDLAQKKIGHYAYNENIEKKSIEKRNEYKSDIKDILLEEKEKQNIINTNEFSKYLNNKKYYNDRAIIHGYNYKNNTPEEKMQNSKNMNYLKKLAFIDQNKTFNANNENGNGNVNTDNSSNDGNAKSKKKSNYENENQIRIGGKLYHMQNQIDQIAKEILNRCKFYSIKK